MDSEAAGLSRQASILAHRADALEQRTGGIEEPVADKDHFAYAFVADLCAIGFDYQNWKSLFPHSIERATQIEWERVVQLRETLALPRMTMAKPLPPPLIDSWWLFWVPDPALVAGENGITDLIEEAVAAAKTEPINLYGPYWAFQGFVYQIGADQRLYSREERMLSVFEAFDRERRSFERIRNKMVSSDGSARSRPRIPERIRIEVWRRDGGKCARCGSRENLEYDHIVPLSQGGSNTARNIELLCEQCNRSKGANIA
jgi:hypothetical protein